MKTIDDVKKYLAEQVQAELAKAKAHTDTGDQAGAVHHLSRRQAYLDLVRLLGE